jgi:predicted phage-related endonuclease
MKEGFVGHSFDPNAEIVDKSKELVVDYGFAIQVEATEKYIAELEETKKVAEERSNQYRAELLKAMETQGIAKWISPNGRVTVSYVEPYMRKGVDAERLKEELPNVYRQYKKETEIKSSIRVKVKKVDETPVLDF